MEFKFTKCIKYDGLRSKLEPDTLPQNLNELFELYNKPTIFKDFYLKYFNAISCLITLRE